MIPSGWRQEKLGKLANKIGSGITPRGGSKSYLSEGIPLIRSQNVLTGRLSLDDVAFISLDQHRTMNGTWLQPNDVLLNITGASIGRSCVVPTNLAAGNVNQHVCIIRPKPDVLNPYYLSSLLNSDYGQKQIATFQAGGNRQGLNYDQIGSFPIPLPPLPEQRKIAAILGTWDEAIRLTAELIAAKQQRKKGLMQRLFNRNLRFKGPDGKEFPAWQETPLNQLLYEHKKRNQELRFSVKDVLSVSGDAGIVNQIEHMGRSYAGKSVANYHVVHHADVVYTKSPLKANPYGIIKANRGKPGIVSTLYAVYSCTDLADSRYLEHYFSLDENVNRYLRPLVRKGAKNDMKINNQHVLSGSMIYPSREEQRKIADFLDTCDDEIKLLQQKLSALQQQKKGLMQRLLTGQVRVKV